MLQWEEVSVDRRHRRLAPIGETRWLVKDQALRKVFGTFGKPDDALFTDLVITLSKIEKDETMKSIARVKARGYLEGLLRYETVLTAQVFLRVFQETTPLSKYLQTSGMDILTAQRLVTGVQNSLQHCSRDFAGVQKAAGVFVEWANTVLQDEEDIEVETALPEKRVRKKKVMPGELAQDEAPSHAEAEYKIKVHNVILDTVTESLHHRFAASALLCSDFACMDPKNFSEIRDKGLQETALEELRRSLLKFDDRANHWETLKLPPLEGHRVRRAIELPQDGEHTDLDQEDIEMENTVCSSCKNCPICCYTILRRYNLLTDAYHLIGLAYKYLLTLSVTQVACERTFSILKFVKNRLRTSLSQEHLEAFLLMSAEKEILMELDSDDIIDKVAETTKLMERLLTY
ncbi:unnamed protein product [Knipowitschia caucasica]